MAVAGRALRGEKVTVGEVKAASGPVEPSRAPGRSVFRNLLASMLAFGAFIGVVFPPFARVVLDSENALSPEFLGMCVVAGLIVGLVNFVLFRVVVSREIGRLATGMRHVLDSVAAAEASGQGCGEDCALEVTSNDALGDVTIAFNDMTAAIARRLRSEEVVRNLGAALSSTVDLIELSDAVLESMADVTSSKAGVVYVDTGEDFEQITGFGFDASGRRGQRLDPSHGPVWSALQSGEVLSLSPGPDGLEWMTESTSLCSFRPRRILVVPLTDEQRSVGAVLLAQSQEPTDDGGVDILTRMRGVAAAHLHNAVLHRKVADLAAIDDLTRVLNRRFGLRRLGEEFSRAVRHGVPLSVIMVDIDHFKETNDRFGHDTGDAVLRTVARRLEAGLRAGDVVCRYGGDEFMIVAPGTGLHDAAALAERMRRAIATASGPWTSPEAAPTVSLGVVAWPLVRVSAPEELVSAADKALYAAKASGRDGVAVHDGSKTVSLEEHQDCTEILANAS